MILRRFTAHLRRQDSTAVVVELMIVVLGVFIGMQASNWNQAQADARLGKDYVQRLTRDLDQDRAALNAEVGYHSAVLKSVRETDELLRAADPDPRALIVNAYRATEILLNPTSRATWDQIVSSGHLGLLPAGAVESGLSQYYAFDTSRDVYSMGLASAYRQTVRKIIPMSMQIAMRQGCSDVRDKQGSIVGFAAICTFDADPAALKAVADALRHDPTVLADLRYQYSFAASAVDNISVTRNSIADALSALGARPNAKGKVSP